MKQLGPYVRRVFLAGSPALTVVCLNLIVMSNYP
jgi:hypothetical protein